ncbi:hypothetical protein pmac_cds_392 [Pandoravirus macleodensis]|uniref:Uncharacterized protein n=1 Tax=Pandoravirus macleodensis TaxID=2107707 RepID=A0A2U7UFJ7_9VIRU|nr:hypothetical protein pmac_cds_392 [Pandoravirus macleodensis]AVK77080.1 hypothetical protein pmac_cds_392 [Pandoravirus macleodensis]
MNVQPVPTTPQPNRMPPDVVFVKLDVATRRAWIVPEGMVVWALARAQHPGRADHAVEQTNGVQRLVATCRAMLDAELGGEDPSPLARAPQRDPQGRLLVDSHGFERLLNGGLVGAAAAALPPAVAQSLTARIHTLSRTPLRRLVTTLASDLEGGSRRDPHESPLETPPSHRPKSIPSTAVTTRISGSLSSSSSNIMRDGVGARTVMMIECDNDGADRRHVTRDGKGGNNSRDDSGGGGGGAGDDDGTNDDAIVSRFVRERCVRRGESCLADALYRSFVTWAPVNARTMARTDFWRAIAAHAVHGFDVDGRTHIVSGLSVPLNTIAASPHPRQDHLPRVVHVASAVAGVVKNEPRRRLPSGDANAISEGSLTHATSNIVKAEPVDEDSSADHTEEFEGGVAKEVRCDPVTGFVAAIDLIFEAADVWGSPQGRKLAARIIYSMRQAGWNFEKRRVGPGRATPLVRAVDVDDFLNAAATFAGRDRAALALARYRETASYRRLMTRMGQHRDPLGRRAAAVHAYECIATHAAAADTPTPTSIEAKPPSDVVPQDSASSKSTQSLLRRRSRMDRLDARTTHLPLPPSLSKRATTNLPDDNDCRGDDSAASERRVRRRISVSSDEEENNNNKQRQQQQQNRPREDRGEEEEDAIKDANARRRDAHDDGHVSHPTTAHSRSQFFSPGQHRSPRLCTEADTRPQPPIRTRALPSKTPATTTVKDDSPRGRDNAARHYGHAFEQTQTTTTTWHGVAVKAEPADGSVDPLLVTMSDEAVYNGRLVDDMAARVAPGSALCVWRRAAGVWHLLLAARPGSDRRRPWRLVGGSHANESSSAPKGDVRWIEWSKVRLTAVDLFSTSPYTVLSIDAECEPPGDDPDAESIGVASSWLFVACREWAAGRWVASDAVMSTLALRIAETAAADPDAPHAREAVAIAKACVRRLHQNHPRPMPSGDRGTA